MVSIKELYRDTKKYLNETITVCGWVKTLRDSKAIGFIEIKDGSFFKSLQIVCSADDLADYKGLMRQNVGAAIRVTGKIVETPGAKQPFELKAESFVIEGESTPEFPLQKKRHSPEFLRTIAHLRPRTNLFDAVFRVRSEAAYAIHTFFHDRGYAYVHTPIITGSDCEGAGEMFRVTTLDEKNPPMKDGEIDYSQDYYKKKTSLTVSGQLNVECFALSFGKVYTFGPTFRAENSNTSRHASEFWMIEPEIAFADLNVNMEVARDMLKFIVKYILDRCPEEMEFFNQFVDNGLIERLQSVVDSEFAHVTYTEAIAILEEQNAKSKFEFPVFWGCDLQSEHERFLAEKHFKRPVFVTDYPKELKSFYMRLNDDNKTVGAMDLLAPGVGEIIGGSEREERLDVLTRRMDELGLNKEDYWWYLDLRRHGGVRHVGYGLGFERFLMYVTGVQNIRDVIPFPRTVGSAEF